MVDQYQTQNYLYCKKRPTDKSAGQESYLKKFYLIIAYFKYHPIGNFKSRILFLSLCDVFINCDTESLSLFNSEVLLFKGHPQ